jgi:cytochrome c oxidase cbb3-type subunit 4
MPSKPKPICGDAMTYDALRHFADSWGLVILVVIFLIIVAFVFRPGSSKLYRHMSRLPLEDDKKKKD